MSSLRRIAKIAKAIAASQNRLAKAANQSSCWKKPENIYRSCKAVEYSRFQGPYYCFSTNFACVCGCHEYEVTIENGKVVLVEEIKDLRS
ncbi:hypothetical protein L596_021860 [Steinernema carpocapsae]|uniref:Uncharacterized protein n=1 Tax=Steinernema carpocapsae TaxID=34508 RepID=A0A4U5MK04_STECR|nr:hypothetical protein L596_021860 [Steinernema carpocapsae]